MKVPPCRRCAATALTPSKYRSHTTSPAHNAADSLDLTEQLLETGASPSRICPAFSPRWRRMSWSQRNQKRFEVRACTCTVITPPPDGGRDGAAEGYRGGCRDGVDTAIVHARAPPTATIRPPKRWWRRWQVLSRHRLYTLKLESIAAYLREVQKVSRLCRQLKGYDSRIWWPSAGRNADQPRKPAEAAERGGQAGPVLAEIPSRARDLGFPLALHPQIVGTCAVQRADRRALQNHCQRNGRHSGKANTPHPCAGERCVTFACWTGRFR